MGARTAILKIKGIKGRCSEKIEGTPGNETAVYTAWPQNSTFYRAITAIHGEESV